MIDREHGLPLTRRSQILELSRSSLYYETVPISDRGLKLMRLIDEIPLRYPYMGSRSIRDQLQDRGYQVGRQHVNTLMKKMGIAAMYRKPRLSKPHPDHKVYPYLLRNLDISRANQVWAADITYIPESPGMEVIQYTGYLFLCRGITGGAWKVWSPGNLQYRPGQPVYIGCIHGNLGKS